MRTVNARATRRHSSPPVPVLPSCGACSGGPPAGMLARMSHTDADTLRRAARLAGFDFAAADLEALRAAIERALEALARLESLPLSSVEPATQYRTI